MLTSCSRTGARHCRCAGCSGVANRDDDAHDVRRTRTASPVGAGHAADRSASASPARSRRPRSRRRVLLRGRVHLALASQGTADRFPRHPGIRLRKGRQAPRSQTRTWSRDERRPQQTPTALTASEFRGVLTSRLRDGVARCPARPKLHRRVLLMRLDPGLSAHWSSEQGETHPVRLRTAILPARNPSIALESSIFVNFEICLSTASLRAPRPAWAAAVSAVRVHHRAAGVWRAWRAAHRPGCSRAGCPVRRG